MTTYKISNEKFGSTVCFTDKDQLIQDMDTLLRNWASEKAAINETSDSYEYEKLRAELEDSIEEID